LHLGSHFLLNLCNMEARVMCILPCCCSVQVLYCCYIWNRSLRQQNRGLMHYPHEIDEPCMYKELQEMPHKKHAFMSQDKVIFSSREKTWQVTGRSYWHWPFYG
jgi:hypothetical protein